jgi:diaminohydroxyphosphoribosylaminopyrimidine deaminase / 5-amino-6-(5-phosphoribosylamino)uracil reductase
MTDSSASSADYQHMARALRLARRGEFSTAPNPSVGCVLLDERGAVVGEGWHRRAGESHAEIHALAEAAGRARGGTAYVTLEPCAHQGRTPPCVDAVVGAGFKRIVIAAQDPNPRVAGEGLRRLEAAGIAVVVGVLEREARELNRGFLARMERGRPWVTVKVGASIDGRTALANGSSQWITTVAARKDVQRLRARASAILTGVGTVLADDPSLTVRDPQLAMFGRQPLRVVLDTNGRIPRSCRVMTDGQPTLVLAADNASAALQASLREDAREAIRTSAAIATGQARPCVAIESVPVRGDRLDLHAVLDRLAAHECNEVLVEAGPALAGAFVAGGHADEVVVYMAATILGDTGRAMFDLPEPLRSLDERQSFYFHDVRQAGADLRLTLRPDAKRS